MNGDVSLAARFTFSKKRNAMRWIDGKGLKKIEGEVHEIRYLGGINLRLVTYSKSKSTTAAGR